MELLVIDGNSIVNRAFYGVPLLTNSAGVHTNAVYGFLNIMFRIIDEEKPQYLAVAFDVKEKTFRHHMYEQYKGTRKPMPAELHEQVPVIREVLKAMGILIMEQPGLEADDILGTMAKRAMKEGLEVSLISGDRDLLQIADTRIKVRIPKTKGGGRTEVEDYYPEDVVNKYGVTPLQFIELKALMGDTADNIPGVPKVGEKTATDLISAFGSVAGVYEHIDEISKKVIKQSLVENKELAELSLKLATIKIDADIPFRLRDAELGNLFTAEAYAICQDLELKTILSRFGSSVMTEEKKCNIVYAGKKNILKNVIEKALKSDRIAVGIAMSDNHTDEAVQLSLFEEPVTSNIAGVVLVYEAENACFIPVGNEIDNTVVSDILYRIYSEAKEIVCFNSKQLYKSFLLPDMLMKKSSKELTAVFFDVLLTAFLLNPLKNDYEICDVASEHLGFHLPTFKQEFPKMSREEAFKKKHDGYLRFLCEEIHALYCAQPVLKEALKEQGLYELYRDIEQPLSLVLYEMEQTGVIVKPDELKEYGEMLTIQINELEKRVFDAAGEKFNLNSPKQLGEILFDKLKLPGAKKTKSGYSTAADVLEGLAGDYPIVAHNAIFDFSFLNRTSKRLYDKPLENNYIDIRIFFEDNEICIPKSHFTFGILPKAYMFIKFLFIINFVEKGICLFFLYYIVIFLWKTIVDKHIYINIHCFSTFFLVKYM